jgi:hypothetical protein
VNIKWQKNILIQELLRQLGPVPLLQEAAFLPHQGPVLSQLDLVLTHQEAAFLPHQEEAASHAKLSAEGIAVQHDVADTPYANFSSPSYKCRRTRK